MAIQQNLLNFKKYLTIEETQKLLSFHIGENVSKADVFQLVLENQLTISIRLQGKEPAFVGSDVGSSSDSLITDNNKILNLMEHDCYLDKLRANGLEVQFFNERANKFYTLDPNPRYIGGIWNLSMIGSEAKFIEMLYQRENGAITKKLKDGFVMLESEYEIARVLKASSYDNNQFNAFSSLQDIPHILVFKKTELDKFIESLEVKLHIPVNKKESFHTKERNSYLIIILALLKQNKIDPTARGICLPIQRMTEEIGIPLSEDTIRKVIKEINRLN